MAARARRATALPPGDRVAGFLPNLPETVIAMLAAASLGAIWSSCSPDFGANGVLDRFGQIEPKVLFCADGYRYAGKEIDSLARVREVCERIPAIERVVVVPYLDTETPELDALSAAPCVWDELARRRTAGPARPPASACRSITRSTSCTPRAPRACPSAWCTAPAARCCST